MRDLPLALIRYCTSAAPRNYDFQPQINPHFSFLKGAFRLKIIQKTNENLKSRTQARKSFQFASQFVKEVIFAVVIGCEKFW